MSPARTLFTGVSIFDGTGSEAFAGEVLVERDRIAAVTRTPASLSVADAVVIDGHGATLMPGLIDGHSHITYPNAADRPYPHLYPPATVETTLMTVHNARLLLDHGFTSAYSAGAIKPGIEAHLRDEISAGRIAGPRFRAASMELYFPGDPDARPMPLSPTDVRAFVRESANEGVDIVKMFVSGLDGVTAASDWELVLTDDAIAAGAQEAAALGLALSAHVRPAAGIKQAVRNGFRVLYHVEDVDDEALALMEARKAEMFCGPTIGGIVLRAEGSRDPAVREQSLARLQRYRETVARLRSRGIRVLPFGDYGFPARPHGHNARDLDFFIRYLGFRPAEVLAAATQLGGELMGGEPVGIIAPTYLADLLLVDGDPVADVRILEDRANLALIMQGGNVHHAQARANSVMRRTTVSA